MVVRQLTHNGGSLALLGDICLSIPTTTDYRIIVEIYLPMPIITHPLKMMPGYNLQLIYFPVRPNGAKLHCCVPLQGVTNLLLKNIQHFE